MGAASCVRTAPEVFDQDDDGRVVLLPGRLGPDLQDLVAEAVDLCPAGALALSPGNSTRAGQDPTGA